MTDRGRFIEKMFKRIFLACLFVALLASSGLAATVKIAVLPWKVNAPGEMAFISDAMRDMLTSRLGSNKAVEVVRPDLVSKALEGKGGDVTDADALEVGKTLSADYVFYGSMTMLGSAISLDGRLASVADGKVTPVYSKGVGLDSVVTMADKLSADVLTLSGAVAPEAVAAPMPTHVVPPGAVAVTTGVVGSAAPVPVPAPAQAGSGFIVKSEEAAPEVWRSAPMEGSFVALAAADLDRDGKKELFIMSKTGLVVARLKDGGLEKVKEFDFAGRTNLSVDAVDSDGDGAPEVYVSSVFNYRASSAVIEYKDNAYEQTITGVDWATRVVPGPSGAAVLVGQRFAMPDGFMGPVVLLKKQGTEVVDTGVFEKDLPDGVDLYRFDRFDLTGDGADELVSIDERNYLRVFKKDAKGHWERDWKSTDFYGGTLQNVTLSRPGSINGDEKSIPVEGRFFHADTDGDGRPELIVKRNVPGGLGRWAEKPMSFTSGEVYSLSWDAGGTTMFKENWKTQKVEGYMTDFILDDLDGDGNKEITMLVVDGTKKLFGTIKTYVLSYRVSI